MNSGARTCTFCVMDESNPAIQFDENGQCNCCRDAINRLPTEWWPGPEGEERMVRLVRHLKERGKDRKYDAMIGLSGGIDSAYLAHLASRQYGLRLLAIHVDCGWNAEAAVSNIESIVRGLGIDFQTCVIEWQEIRDIQVAFLKAGVLNQDMPQDHAFFSTLYRTANRFGIRDFLSGVNFASENITPPNFGYPSIDGKHIRSIHALHCKEPLQIYPIMGVMEYLWMTRVRKKLVIHKPLNFHPYNKESAQEELKAIYSWRDYGNKHSESRFTKFYQDIYLPRKFNFDKRRLHLSSLIVSGQLTREAAIAELSHRTVTDQQVKREVKFVAKKLGLTEDELRRYIDSPPKRHIDYPNNFRLFNVARSLKRLLRMLVLRNKK